MSGPVRTEDVPPDGPPAGATTTTTATTATAGAPAVEVTASREARVGDMRVLRALPRRGHRTVGAWCFADHMAPPGPAGDPGGARLDIGPHPHIGLQTVTWLLAGEVVHRDSLGSEQPIRPGQLNLMTAGHGVAHAEETPGGAAGAAAARATGVQLWVAQPEATRHGPAAFEHHAELPQAALGGAVATVLVGELAGAESPARRDTDHMGADLALPAGTTAVPLRPDYEHALVVLAGRVGLGDDEVTPGHLAYLAPGRAELALRAAGDARVLLLGGVPFPEPIVMWWNFVARSHDEVDAARRDWQAGGDRFGTVDSGLEVIPAPPTPWRVRT
jgi:quercetin 2,3-dioxygenase